MTNAEIIQSLAAMRLFAANQQWSVDAGTDNTGWSICSECNAPNWLGHKDGCIVPGIFVKFDSAVAAIKEVMAE
jgi:hypothetical protein